jgi:peptide/nickel transport system permease protein
VLRYLARRLLLALGVLWAAWSVSFVVLYLLPSDPIEIMASGGLEAQEADPARLAALRHEYGFDRPAPVQYASHLWAALHGDLGRSVQSGRAVTGEVAAALPHTLQLAGTALALAVVGGVAIALVAAWSRQRGVRQALLSLPVVGVSVPTFWVGLMLVHLLSFRFPVFPAIGDHGWRSLVLPAVTLALPTGAQVSQVLAKSLLATLGDPYVETARAKGAGRTRVLLGHALRNAALPALTVAGVLVGVLLAGSVVVETVFSRPGLGRLTITAVTYQDIPVVQGVVMVGALAYVTSNLLVDLLYPLLDPRIVAVGRQVARPEVVTA